MSLSHSRPMLACVVSLLVAGATVVAAELHEATSRAFELYAAAVEGRSASPFLWVDARPPAERDRHLRDLREGGLVIERLHARDRGREIEVPDGLVHHWLGTVYVPGATLEATVRLLQDYDRHDDVYAPAVSRSRLIAHGGDQFTFGLRFVMTKGITVVVDGEHEARFAAAGPHRARSWIRSARLAEVSGAGTADERLEPVGHGGGYLWRLNSYWRFEERDGGVFVECESISLTRGIPYGLGWIVGPFVTSLPRESMELTLVNTRKALTTRPR